MTSHSIEVIAHNDLTEAESGELRRPVDIEYLKDHGKSDPEQPYGYAAHDIRVI